MFGPNMTTFVAEALAAWVLWLLLYFGNYRKWRHLLPELTSELQLREKVEFWRALRHLLFVPFVLCLIGMFLVIGSMLLWGPSHGGQWIGTLAQAFVVALVCLVGASLRHSALDRAYYMKYVPEFEG